MDLTAWLDGIGLSAYAELFAEHAIDEDVLCELTEEHLKELGLPLGHRLKLLKAITRLKLDTSDRLNPQTVSVHEAGQTSPAPAGGSTDEPSLEESLEPERRHLTVMFCDLVGSTGISARLDPEDMRELILAYQNAVADAVARFDGHVAKFMGDGSLSYFGWPRAFEDAAERAVRAGRAIITAVKSIEPPFGTPLAVRIGMATGLVVVGDLIGEGEARERSIVGDTPNLAARLQSLAKPGEIIIATSTRRLIGDVFEVVDLGQHDVKGLPMPVGAWKVLGEGHAEGRFEALHGKTLMPLVGREEELELLLRRWELTKSGSGQVVLMTGEPGIGKSHLSSALRDRLPAEAKRDVRLYCSHYHANTGLHPTIDHLERAAGWETGDSSSTRLEKLETLIGASGLPLPKSIPLLAAMMSLPTGDRYPPLNLDPRTQKAETLSMLVGMLEAFSRDRPILMLVEDAHWLDPTSIELFDLIIERIPAMRVLLVVTYRPEFKTRWIGPPHVTLLTLNRLALAGGAAIIDRVASGKALPREVTEQILAKTDGIPLFVEELTRNVLETGLLVDAGDHYELGEPLSTFAIPNSLQDSLMARLDRLAPAREIAQIAACIGREFDHGLLAEVAAPRSQQELDAALGSLVASELIFAHGVPPDATYRFKHALVQDAAYQTLLKSRRVAHHQRIARALERISPDVVAAEPELIAHHYTEARQPKKALDYWMRAGRKAMAGSGNLEAIEHFSRALEQTRELPPSEDRNRSELDILIALAVPQTSAKGYASGEVAETYTRARELGGVLGETAALFPALYGLWRFHLLGASYGQARELAAQLLELAQQSDDPVFDVAAHRAMGSTLFYVGELKESLRLLEHVTGTPVTDEARERILTFDVADPWVASHAYSGWAHWLLGRPDRARKQSQAAIVLAEQIGHKFSIALSKCFAAWTYQFCGDRRRTGEVARDVLQFARDNGFQFWIGWAEIMVAWASDDPPAKIAEAIRIGLDDWLATRSRLGLSYFLYLLAEAWRDCGRGDAALEAIDEAARFVDEADEQWWASEIVRVRCELLRDRPDADHRDMEDLRAAAASAKAAEARGPELRLVCDLAQLQARNGKAPNALSSLSDVLEGFAEGFDTEDLRRAHSLRQELTQNRHM